MLEESENNKFLIKYLYQSHNSIKIMIKGIIFDLDGVYFKNGKKNFIKKVSSRFGVDARLVKEVFLKSEMMRKYKEGKVSGDEFWKYAIGEWKIKSTPKEILKILKQGYELNDIAIKLIKKLRADGVKSIVCSNNFRERVKVLDERFGFLKDFDYIVLSYEYGILKPKLLEKVVEKTKFKPEEIVVVDDGEEIIEEAKRMGFKAILCENPDIIEDYLREVDIFLEKEHELKK